MGVQLHQHLVSRGCLIVQPLIQVLARVQHGHFDATILKYVPPPLVVPNHVLLLLNVTIEYFQVVVVVVFLRRRVVVVLQRPTPNDHSHVDVVPNHLRHGGSHSKQDVHLPVNDEIGQQVGGFR